MDELAHKMGISKKTLYEHFNNKEMLVVESLKYMLKRIKVDIDLHVNLYTSQPLKAVMYIYNLAFNNMEQFSPSFVFGLKKYYTEAYEAYEGFRKEIVYGTIIDLLEKAKTLKQIRADINFTLFCDIHYAQIENILFSGHHFFERYQTSELLEYLILNGLRGIMTQPKLLDDYQL